MENRYSRQIRFAPIGSAGQSRLATSRVIVVGCGALGSAISNLLVRSGVGLVKIVDRDFVDITNLQRQVLFDESDVANNLPKAVAAKIHLEKINSTIAIEAEVTDVDATNIEQLVQGMDLILDGSDNFELRFLINDVAIKHAIPWVYGGCLGAEGQSMTILPGQSPCLNCLLIDGPPLPGTSPTCDSAGILATIVNLIASVQVNEGLKILTGNAAAASRCLSIFSLWDNRFKQLPVEGLRDKVDCPTCRQHQYRWLNQEVGYRSAILCGRNAVQLSGDRSQIISLPELAERLGALGHVEANRYLLKFYWQDYVLTIFSDGRTIVSGTEDTVVARQLFSQFVGN